MKRANDLTGQRFGRWTVIKYHGKDIRGRTTWACICDCGEHSVVRRDLLTRGLSKSCGCLSRELKAKRLLKHGYCVNKQNNGNPTYVSWKSMKQRCYNTNADQYPDYGGRGIRVCDRWRYSFENFLADMGERPLGTTIDRINNNGDYEPGNCRWVNLSIQNKNKRKDNTRRAVGGVSRYKGVTKHYNKWQSSCTVQGKRFYLGVYDSEVQAAAAYDMFAKTNCGERAWLNSDHFPECALLNY